MDELYLSREEFFYEITPLAQVWIFSGLDEIFQLQTHVEIVIMSFVGSSALSSLFLSTEKREVSSAKKLALDFNPSIFKKVSKRDP